jgi:hypothetical protein
LRSRVEGLETGYLARFPKSGSYYFWGIARPEFVNESLTFQYRELKRHAERPQQRSSEIDMHQDYVHTALQHGGHGIGKAGATHDHHAGHSVAMFRDKFWLSFALTIPVVFWSTDVQKTRLSRPAVVWTTTSTMARAKSSARIT